jgi:SNF2 family DNA or RNA helicase
MQPELSPTAAAWIKASKAEAAARVVTDLPEDSERVKAGLPWGDKLRPYQRAGVDFLIEHPHSILADEMGLGKTIQSISAVLMATGELGPKLVVCPNSVKVKWRKEIKSWTGQEAFIIDGKNAPKRKSQLDRAIKQNAWVIINWEKLRIMHDLGKVKWSAVIADEAHRAKNRKAQQTKALWKIKAPIQLALTGTPIQNSPDELWALLKWLFPKQYTSYWRFFNDYVDYYEGHFGRIITGVKHSDQLRFELRDKMVRRDKGVLNLPPIQTVEIPVALGSKQRKIYDEAERLLWLEIERDANEGNAQAQKFIENPTYLIQNGAARTTRLRQIASSPALLGGHDESAKFDACVELITDQPKDKKFVVFTEFKMSAEIIMERLLRAGVNADYIHGEVPPGRREQILEDMQEGELQALVMTRDTGGEGIDLYAADTAIFIERHWTPARNDQAESRLHRYGQTKPVTIYNLVASDTIDDGKVKPANLRKEAIVSEILGKGIE